MSISVDVSALLENPALEGWTKNPRYPLLFKTEKSGKSRVWLCWVEEDVVVSTDGLVAGKIKNPSRHKYAGNTLRPGAVQAPLEAEKAWLKRVGNGYQPRSEDEEGLRIYQHVLDQKALNGGMNRGVKMFGETEIRPETTAGALGPSMKHAPMLSKKYKDWKGEEFTLTPPARALTFPVMVQPKLDGVRCVAYLQNGQVQLESRNGKGYMHLEHVRASVQAFLKHMEAKGFPEAVLDGELYVHHLERDGKELTSVGRYQFISEACKVTRKVAHPEEHHVQFWLFDLWTTGDRSNKERWETLKTCYEGLQDQNLVLVPTREVHSHEAIEETMAEFVGERDGRVGYAFEGLMMRRPEATYVSSKTHSSCLLKYKRFEDEEWYVKGAETCVGGLWDGCIKWRCTRDGKEVSAQQIGDLETSRELYAQFQTNPGAFIGRSLNLRFNDRSKDGIPRFPHATAFVEDKA